MSLTTKIVANMPLSHWYNSTSTVKCEAQVINALLAKMEPTARELFLTPSLKSIPDPFLMKDMESAVATIIEHIIQNRKILVAGDYDVDGVTSSALLARFFKLANYKNYVCFIPNRFKHGYGLTSKAVTSIIQEKPDLVITVDSGTTSSVEVDRLKENGIEVIVTDHHTPLDGKLPSSLLINPKQAGCNFPDDQLAGVGVVFILIIALRVKLRELNYWRDTEPNLLEHLDLVAIGTIADQVPLVGLNRIFACFGLAQMNRKLESATQEEFFSYLQILAAKTRIKFFDSGNISFQVAPLINAAGRMGDAGESLNFLLAEDKNKALSYYQQLDSMNRKRKKIQTSMCESAYNQASSQVAEQRAGIVLYKPDFHEGLLGILANRISDEFSRPVVAVTQSETGVLKASCRSKGANILDILQDCQAGLTQYGGHPSAAGCTITQEGFDKFKELFFSACQKHSPEAGSKPLVVDIEVNLDILTFELIDQLKWLEPYGQANNKPLFLIRNLSLPPAVPINGKHLKWRFGPDLEMIYWNGADKLPTGESFDIAFTFGKNQFRGELKRQLIIHAVSG